MRKVTNDVISAVEDGLLDWEEVARACLNYLSEDDVEDMVRLNGWAITDDELFDDLESEDADLAGKIVKYNGMTVKVLRKLTEQEKQGRAHLNNPDAGDYYEVETTAKEIGSSKFIVWETRLRDSLTEDVAEDLEDDFVFVSEMRHKDYVIEFFRHKQDGKYYWQAEYDGEDRKLSNFNIWIATRGISLYSEDEEGYPAKADVVDKAKEWVSKQKDRW